MRGFVDVILVEDPCHIGPSTKGTDGLVCRRVPKIMLKSVTSVRDTP